MSTFILLSAACGTLPASPTPAAAHTTTPISAPTPDTAPAANQAALPPTPTIEVTIAGQVQATTEAVPTAIPFSSLEPTASPTPERTALPSPEPTITLTPSPTVVAPDSGTPTQTTPRGVRLIRSLATVYYQVSGTTTQDIFDSVKANGPVFGEETQGHFTSGLTESNSSYRVEFLDRGESCDLQSVTINLDFIVTLPEYSDPSSLSDLQPGRWQDFAEAVAVHEQTHVDIYEEGIEVFRSGVESLPETFPDCRALEAHVSSVWDLESTLTDQKQEGFHESEARLSESLRGPVQQLIDANELELAELQADLNELSSATDDLKVQIDDLEVSMQPYDAGIAAIKEQYPDLVLPSETFDEYERLFEELNRLNDLRNGVIIRMNGLIEQQNRTVEEFNTLTKETNQLIDDLVWLP